MTLRTRLGIVIVLAVGTPLLVHGTALPEVVISSATSLTFDPSVRAAGMGWASTAVCWGDDPGYWANPALLGYYRGIHYDWSKTQLAPGLAEDVWLTAKSLTLGSWGLGLSIAGEPWDGLGGLKLDYGEMEAMDPEGNPLGRFSSHEDVKSWAVGLSIVELTESAVKFVGWEVPSISRFGDVSLGTSRNSVSCFYAPAWLTESGVASEGTATTSNRGFLLRLTPYNSVDFPGFLPELDSFLRPAIGGIRLDLSYGASVHNCEDSKMEWLDGSRSEIAKDEKLGRAVHVAVGFPGVLEDGLKAEGIGWLAELFTPLISWGEAWDRTHASMRDAETGERLTEGVIKLSGWELTIANVFTIRRGRIDEPSDFLYGIHGATSGWGLGLRVADAGGFRYDEATVPQSILLEEKVHRKALAFWANPLGVWRILHRPGQHAETR